MSRDDETPGPEFIDPDEPEGTDEDLALPPHRALRGTARQRHWAAAAVVLAVLAGVAVHGRFTTTHHVAAKPTPSLAPTTATPPVPTPTPPGGFVAHLGDRDGSLRQDIEVSVPRITQPPRCPQANNGQAACVAVHTVPAAFTAAVRARFPTAKQAATLTEQVRPAGAENIHRLWSRTFTATIGRGRLTIVVRPGGDDTSFPIATVSSDNGRSVLAYSHHETSSFTVEVQISGPSGNEPSLTRLSALSGDPRLVLLD